MSTENNEEFDQDGFTYPIQAGYRRDRKQKVLAFDVPASHNEDPLIHTSYPVMPQQLFKPMGLLLSGTSPETKIHSFTVGVKEQLIGSVPIPGAFYETGKSFAALKELADNNELAWPGEEKIIFGHCDAAEVGNQITLRISGPVRHAAMWGYTIE